MKFSDVKVGEAYDHAPNTDWLDRTRSYATYKVVITELVRYVKTGGYQTAYYQNAQGQYVKGRVPANPDADYGADAKDREVYVRLAALRGPYDQIKAQVEQARRPLRGAPRASA